MDPAGYRRARWIARSVAVIAVIPAAADLIVRYLLGSESSRLLQDVAIWGLLVFVIANGVELVIYGIERTAEARERSTLSGPGDR